MGLCEKIDGNEVKLIMEHKNRPSTFDKCEVRDWKREMIIRESEERCHTERMG